MKRSLHVMVTVILTLSALFIILTGTAYAATLNLSGTIDATDPSMPVAFISTPNCTGQGATQVFYETFAFHVDVAGDYTISMTSDAGFASLYVHFPTLNPISPFTNCIAADNNDPITVTLTLAANTIYHVTPFDDTFAQAGGSYNLTITGPGNPALGAPIPPGAPTPVEIPCANPLSSTVQGRMLYTVNALFEPNAASGTNVTIPGGTAWWITGAQNGFYRIWISCASAPVWVPAESMGPNYDPPWNGAPLPNAGG